MKKITSNDIAKMAGVSRSTVSRVINGYSNIPPETRDKVMKVIQENHYYPQLSGQLLTGKQMNTIGFFWASGGNIANSPLTSSFFVNTIEAAASRSYLVLTCILGDLDSDDNINYVKKIFMEGRIDAGIIVGADNNEPFIDELLGLGKIVGLFDYYHENETTRNRITVNFDRTSGEQAIDYLYGLGHRKIGIIDGNMSRFSSMQRHEGYLRGMLKHHLPIQNKWLCYGGITEESGYEAAKSLLYNCNGDYPTAICASNDSVAFGVYRACSEYGLKIPEDISVIGNDGDITGEHSTPPLTTISFNFKDMFYSLVSRVIDVIEDKEDVETDIFIPGTFTERSSCKRID
ncbi:substrate-binding domain-containing protein [Anaerocolumna sedimenticola]|uniref:Substrate-binding domain-containing protein n=1 Tax=Anaerocolumna sedimenticola TaxID=2696063 RepID=A0A6P1TQR0_9FIRM|nr:LacI family DNA-binding transcriptional regulator [Anaerocolumna sedimenticola]QHQ63274.1 substrate-binding domain-containing protein [Anaerocolumna sedimenticola]